MKKFIIPAAITAALGAIATITAVIHRKQVNI